METGMSRGITLWRGFGGVPKIAILLNPPFQRGTKGNWDKQGVQRIVGWAAPTIALLKVFFTFNFGAVKNTAPSKKIPQEWGTGG
jgi:hypothetical protein